MLHNECMCYLLKDKDIESKKSGILYEAWLFEHAQKIKKYKRWVSRKNEDNNIFLSLFPTSGILHAKHAS